MKPLLSVVAGAALALIAQSGARASDMPIKSNLSSPVIPSGWSGFYLGANGGGGWERQTFDQSFFLPVEFGFFPPGPPNLITTISGNGGVFGGQFGYNWQPFANWIAGIEADIEGTTIKGITSKTNFNPALPSLDTNRLETKIRDLGTMRAKIGFAPLETVLVYGTAGLAWGRVTSTLSLSSSPSLFAPLPPFFVGTVTQLGWSAGIGADWRLAQNLILGVLYLHYDLGSGPQTVTAVASNGSVDANTLPNSTVRVDSVTARLSWLIR
jgi:outer membrane immunogenic protein